MRWYVINLPLTQYAPYQDIYLTILHDDINIYIIQKDMLAEKALLTHRGRDKKDAISQTFLNSFSWIKI